MYLAPGIMIGFIWVSNCIKKGIFLSNLEIQSAKFNVQSCQGGTKLKSIFLVISFLVILSAYYLTYSYASWGALFLSLMIIVSAAKKIKIKYFLLSLLLVGAVFLVQADKGKFQDLIGFSERSSLASRLMIWRASGKMIADNWFWGIGPGNFQEKYLEYQKYYPPYLEWAVPHPHNVFLAFWLSAGILGLLSFLGLEILFFWEFFKQQKNALKILALGVMLGILFNGLGDTTYFKNDLAIIFWLVYLGMLKGNED
jgi:O-antigen ligase